jgi:hypothetical protein
MEKDAGTDRVVRVLAEYLQANPSACDTADGIGRWWIGAYRFSAEELVQALERMKRQGLLEELVAVDGRLRYRRCASEAQLRAIVAGPGTRH